eukprot:2335212-Pleurochrysis_carterae.AAC.4
MVSRANTIKAAYGKLKIAIADFIWSYQMQQRPFFELTHMLFLDGCGNSPLEESSKPGKGRREVTASYALPTTKVQCILEWK